jgi:hypothetical protein
MLEVLKRYAEHGICGENKGKQGKSPHGDWTGAAAYSPPRQGKPHRYAWQDRDQARRDEAGRYRTYQDYLKQIWARVQEHGHLRDYPKGERTPFTSYIKMDMEEGCYQLAFTSAWAYFYVTLWLVGLLGSGAGDGLAGIGLLLVCIACLSALPRARYWMPYIIWKPLNMVMELGLKLHEMTVLIQHGFAAMLPWVGTLIAYFFFVIPHIIGTYIAFAGAWVYGHLLLLWCWGVDLIAGLVEPHQMAYYAGLSEMRIMALLAKEPEILSDEDKAHLEHLYQQYQNI